MAFVNQKKKAKHLSAKQKMQETSHKLYMWRDFLAGNLILVREILLCFATLLKK